MLSDLSGSSFCDLRNPVKKQTPQKLKRSVKVCSEEINSVIKDLNFEVIVVQIRQFLYVLTDDTFCISSSYPFFISRN